MAAHRVAPEDSGRDRRGFVRAVAVDPAATHAEVTLSLGFESLHALNQT